MSPQQEAHLLVVPGAMIDALKNFQVVIKASTWEDIQELELPDAPQEGDTLETKYGTCEVTSIELAERGKHAGRIVCRLP